MVIARLVENRCYYLVRIGRHVYVHAAYVYEQVWNEHF